MLQDAARAERESRVVLDATALQRFDSSALAVLLAVRRTCQQLGKTLVVSGLSEQAHELAVLYGVAELLETAADGVV